MSIIRPEKRDPNYVRNKSDIGLSKVDNVSSAEFASMVLDQVRRYLNRETIYQTLGRRFIALAKIGCKDDGSGNLIKILSGNLFITFAVLNESEEIREAVKLETIYSHYVNGTEVSYEDDTTKVEYNIFMTEDPALLNECYLEFRENIYEDASGTTVTEMYVILRCDAGNLPFVSSNLFEYSNGGVSLDPTVLDDATLASYTLIESAKLDHNRFSLVDRSEATVGFEIYDEAGNPVRVRETTDSIDPGFDIPKINGVPFTGRKGVFVEGRNTRQITVNAMHSGSSLLEAGEHDWEVINYAPRAGYTYFNKEQVLHNNVYPQKAAFLDKDSFEARTSNSESTEQDYYGYGMVRLSGCGNNLSDGVFLPNRMFDPDLPLSEKTVYLYEWSDSLSKTDTDVIPVRVFKTFVDSVVALFDDQVRKMADLRDILKSIDAVSSENKKKLDKMFTNASNALGYHYIFDYANTSDSVTLVPHTGMEDKTYEIKMGVIGNGDGASISMSSSGDIDRGGDTSWVRISRIDNRQEEGGSVTFSFSPNKTNSSRFGYYIIYSNAYRTDGSRIGLVYRFYQDVITSSLRIKYIDEHQLTEYYGLGAVVQKKIDNEGEIVEFDQICVVDNSILDESGNPSRIDRILGYYIDNRFESSAVTVETIRVEEENRILGFRASFPKNNTNDERIVKIHVLQNNLDVLVLQLEQNPREFEYTAPDSLTVGGYSGSTVELQITSNKDWVLEAIKGGNNIKLTTDDKDSGDVWLGHVPNGKDEVTFKRILTVLKNNTTDKVNEIAILKLYADGDGSKYKRITIFQNGQPALSSIGTTRVNIPYYEGGTTTIDDFYCTYDWVISVSPELQEWCKIEPESGKKVEDVLNPTGTQLTLTALKTTKSVSSENRGTFTIKYAGVEETIEVIQDKAGFEFDVDVPETGVLLGYAKGAAATVKVESNYDWTIELVHQNAINKRFKACVDNTSGKIEGVNGSSINIEALDDSSSDTQDVFLGSINIYSLGELVKKFDIYQSKVTVSIDLQPSSDAGWYADGGSKQKGGGTNVTIPIKVTPSSATVTATYSISGGGAIAATVKDTDTAGEKVVTIPGPGANNSGNNKSITVIARAESAGSAKEDKCSIVQNGFTNGIRVTIDGSSVDYYGGTRNNIESTNYFAPIIGNTKTVKNIYEPLGASKLSVDYPSWLSISTNTTVDKSSNDYLLKTRKTKNINMTGKNRTGNITITSGADNDKTVITIPVVQYFGTWYFGTKTTDYGKTYSKENPYPLDISSTAYSEASLSISSYYTYNSKNVYEDITVSMESGSDWCEASKSVSGNDVKIIFKTKSANNTATKRSALAKVTQNDTGSIFYVGITQGASATLNIYGGVKGIKYVIIDTSVDVTLDSAQINNINSYATIFEGAGTTDSIAKSIYKSSVTYLKYNSSTKKVTTEKLINAAEGTTLYFATLYYGTAGSSTPTKLTTSLYSKNEYYSSLLYLKHTLSGNSSVTLQPFGTNRINIGELVNHGTEYEFILSSRTTKADWETESMIKPPTCYIKTGGGQSIISTYFVVDNNKGVGFYHPGSMVTPTHQTTGPIELYVYRKPTSSSVKAWERVGFVLWTNIGTEFNISWTGPI